MKPQDPRPQGVLLTSGVHRYDDPFAQFWCMVEWSEFLHRLTDLVGREALRMAGKRAKNMQKKLRRLRTVEALQQI